MIRVAKRLPSTWQLRIGIHAGPVVAGIVGRQKYQYDIWGDTVNSAARLQAEALPGTLYVSSSTWNLIGSDCHGASIGFREIKGKGQQEIYRVDALVDTD